jgi:hypothetical protein
MWVPSLFNNCNTPNRNQMCITMAKHLKYSLPFNYRSPLSYFVHQGQNHFPTCMSSKNSIRHPICQPLEYQTHTNMINALEDSMYNRHQRLVGATYKDGSIWPSTLWRWHSVQYMCMWYFHVWPFWAFWASNNNILEDNSFHTQNIYIS